MNTATLIALCAFAPALAHAARLNGWRRALRSVTADPVPDDAGPPPVTVVIAARDAAEDIVPLLQDLYASAHREGTEVIVVDDHSSDGTAGVVERMALRWPGLRLLRLSDAQGKKAALMAGVEAARNDLVVFTDADVRTAPARIGTIARHHLRHRWDLCILPVRTVGDGLLGMVQEEEQAALFAAAVGTWSEGAPLLAYGANLAVRKQAFTAVGGHAGDRWASGDDVFLLARIRARGGRIALLAADDVVVGTAAVPVLREAIAQRLRWAGKMRGSRDVRTLLGSAFGLLLPWYLLLLSVALLDVVRMGQGALFALALLVAAWCCWLFPTLGAAGDARAHLHGRRAPWRTFTALLAFTVYAPLIAVASLVVRPRWKGRRV